MKISVTICLLILGSTLEAINVTSNDDSSSAGTTAGTLRYAMLHLTPSDNTITFAATLTGMAPANTIALTQSLPAIVQDVTFAAPSQITIDGGSSHQVFSVAIGTVVIPNIVVQNALSLGGAGGTGSGGGGGGAAGGAALYVHKGTNVTLNSVTMTTNQATGGAGGNGNNTLQPGGGGGGFGGGAGGAGTGTKQGGGGGGNSGGGAGGTGSGAGGAGGLLNRLYSGGGGGGVGDSTFVIASAGGLAYLPPNAVTTNSGGSFSGFAGGGGAGLGANGGEGIGTAGPGGKGIGVDQLYGGGGGGGGDNGYGVGFGGGGAGDPPGFGGELGGGEGGNGGPDAHSEITGGFGGGGSGGAGGGGGTIFGGGTGGVGATAGGGGGAAMGGSIFIQQGGTLTLENGISITGGNCTGGAAGTGGGATAGTAYGLDIFIRTGGTLIFNNTIGNITISSNIDSDQGVGGGTGGGVILNGTQTVILSGINTYSGGTTINSGNLSVSTDPNLGQSGQSIKIGAGELLATGNLSSSRPVTLIGSAKVDTQENMVTLSGLISGSGSLTKLGSGGTLILAAGNTYSGGTTLTAGTLQIAAGSSLGSSSATLSIGTATLFINTTPVTLSQTITLTGNATFNPGANTLNISGPIGGSGSLIMSGAGGILNLTGANTYSGGTTITAGTVGGNTTSLQGNIQNNGTLTFSQATDGTYSSVLTGNGQLNLGGGGTFTFSGNSAAFSGASHLIDGELNITGSLAGTSLLTVDSGAALSGAGTVGNLSNSGTLNPGSLGTAMTVDGTLFLANSSDVEIGVTPSETNSITITGAATLDGNLTVTPGAGFYGFSVSYEILDAASIAGTFLTPTSTNPNFTPSVTYPGGNTVLLKLTVANPFLDFPFDSYNTESVGNNLSDLRTAGYLTDDSLLFNAIDSLSSESFAAINDALDQMHPATFSAFAEVQAAVGGQLLTMFHRRPAPSCACSNGARIWAEPYGNWLKEKQIGEEVGFYAKTQGVAAGIDGEIRDGWVVGIGGGWNDMHLYWNENRGTGSTLGYYGAVYTDITTKNYYIGASVIAGIDRCTTTRQLIFGDIDQKAHGSRYNTSIMGQLATAVFFGPSMCFAFPYLNVDLLYLNEGKVTESGAPGLNLDVAESSGTTLRSEAGFAVQVQDTNRARTMCISPLFGLGWAMECPLTRHQYKANFEGQPISFHVKGWDYTWQLFTLRFGFTITYRCFSAYGNYVAEMSPLDHTPFFEQRGDIRFSYAW